VADRACVPLSEEDGSVAADGGWRPRHGDPLFIMAMDHRGSFGSTLFKVENDRPTPEQRARMVEAKQLIYRGLAHVSPELPVGRAGVLVDEEYGEGVIEAARRDGLVLAVPLEASGHDWFTLLRPADWVEHLQGIGPDYAKVLVRDNPDLPEDERRAQLRRLAEVSAALHKVGTPLIYELLVPATPDQLTRVGGDAARYDAELRPELVTRVIAENQDAGIEPALWKVEGLETTEAAREVADQARTGGRDADLIVLGRDAPEERVNHWLAVASAVEAFVGFAIGRSIWEDAIRAWTHGELDDAQTSDRVAATYLAFCRQWAA
jgi:myo-inositol catabolism protein IolC